MKKGMILIIVLGVMFILTILAVVALNLMTTESRVAEHKIRRTRAYYASQAGIVDGLEQLRKGPASGGIAPPAVGTGRAYCLANEVNGYKPLVVVVSRGATYTITAGTYTCSKGGTYACNVTAPSPYCVYATVDDYSQ